MKIWYDDDQEWVNFNEEEFEECFSFVTRPDFKKIREIYVHNGGINTWLDVVYNNRTHTTFEKQFGTFV